MSFVVVRWSTQGPQLQHLGCEMFATLSAWSAHPQLEPGQAREDLWHFQSGDDKDKSLMLQRLLWSSWPEGGRLRDWRQGSRVAERKRVQPLQFQELKGLHVARERASCFANLRKKKKAKTTVRQCWKQARSEALKLQFRSTLWRTTLAVTSRHTDPPLTLALDF